MKAQLVFALTLGLLSPVLTEAQPEPQAFSIQIQQHLESRNQQRKVWKARLSELEKKVDLASLAEVNEIWREVGSRTLDLFSDPGVILVDPESESAEFLQKELWEKEVELNSFLLNRVSQLRSQLLEKKYFSESSSAFEFSEDYFADILREVELVPLKWRALFYSKVKIVSSSFHSGVEGVFRLIRESTSFLLFLLVPFFLYLVVRKVQRELDKYHKWSLQPYNRSSVSLKSLMWVQRLRHYLPLLMSFLSVLIADWLLKGTVISEIRVLFPYITYFLFYLLYLNLVEGALRNMRLRSIKLSKTEIRKRLYRSFRFVGLFFLIGFFILHAAETTVGRSLVFHITKEVLFLFGIVICAIAAWRWRRQISENLPDSLGEKLKIRFQKAIESPFSILFALPFLLLTLAFFLLGYIWSALSRFDFIKRLSAQIFRQRLERAAGANESDDGYAEIPEDYVARFEDFTDSESDCFSPSRDVLSELSECLNDWLGDSEDENSLALVGEKGSGKSALLKRLRASQKQQKFVFVKVDSYTEDSDTVLSLVAQALGLEETARVEDIRKWDKSAEKTVVVVEGAHHLFQSTVRGFETYKKFLDLVNSSFENIFWCVSFDLNAWKYLNSVFKKSPFFRHCVEMPSWSEEDIAKLILSRHNQSEYQLSYDQIISATQGSYSYEAEYSSEKSFFRLLWEQSKGNPRAALVFWLTSLRWSGGKTLKVGLPDDPSSKTLQDLNIETLLVYASILRHGSLRASEMHLTTEVSKALVRQAQKIGLERRVLERKDKGYYQVTTKWQSTLSNFLMKKNLLNGR